MRERERERMRERMRERKRGRERGREKKREMREIESNIRYEREREIFFPYLGREIRRK